jgi:phospholipid-binding lipoprotein MlaA
LDFDKDGNMRRYIWLIAVLAVMSTGCAASKRAAANRSDSVVSPNPMALPDDANEAGEMGEDDFDEFDEFDLIEEELDKQEVKISDPLRPLNRAMFTFNDKLYFWIIKPCASACKKTVPRPARVGIRNFFHNLTTPVRFVSCHLQGRHKDAGRELHRFAYNTTFGVLGFGDPAKDKLGLEPAEADLGQTLGKWGFGTGIYLVLPFFGPSNVRDTTGLVGAQFLNPVRYVDPDEASIAISAVDVINDYSFKIGEYESFKEAAYDPYIAMRQAYIQYRQKKIEEVRAPSAADSNDINDSLE